MSTFGKNKSFVKRRLAQERTPNVVSRTIIFQHQATGVGTVIDLTNLNTPSEAAANGFANPSASSLPFVTLYRQNVKVESTYKDVLEDYRDYVILNNYQIQLINNLTTEPGEIFTITLVLPNNTDIQGLLSSLSDPLALYNQALYGVNSLLPYNSSSLGTQILNILSYVTSKNRSFTSGDLDRTNALITPSGTYPGSNAFVGGVLLPDGRVFCVPHNSTTARIYNPATDTLTTPTGTYPGSSAFDGGVLLPDGRVFCVPFNSTTARIYDPATDTLTTPTGTYPGTNAFAGGVLLPDGRVFCVPFNSTTARIYDPATDTLSTPTGTYPGSSAFVGGVLLPDGRVFCVPFNSTTARIYDPATDTLTTPTGTYPGSSAFDGGVLLPDGRVFCVPYSSTSARIFSGTFSKYSNNFSLPMTVALSAFLNKL